MRLLARLPARSRRAPRRSLPFARAVCARFEASINPVSAHIRTTLYSIFASIDPLGCAFSVATLIRVPMMVIPTLFDAITFSIQPSVDPIATTVELILDTVTLAVQAVINPVACRVEPIGEAVFSGVASTISLSVKTIFDPITTII
jgi:hypothetical protein